MSELHLPTMSFFNNIISSNSSQGWDDRNNNLDSLGILNSDTMSLVMGDENSSFLSPLGSEILDDDDFSTGYLEDALVEFSDRSKRRRLLVYADNDHDEDIIMRDHHYSNHLLSKSYWEMSHENFTFMSDQFTDFNELLSGGGLNTEMKTISEEEETLDSSSSYSYKDSANNTNSISEKETLFSADPSSDSSSGGGGGGGGGEVSKKRVITRVVYPFAVVKPGGREGEVTLNDINERILMPPTRPVRHPVGDFACRPCVSPHGPGLSGKAVVALTKIQTQGRGTITIIRTKG
ncbi:protein XRI1-like [Humulus lupulus]|uniref:protein XRI1-like n=1 Tax=Humulus lupulus TaxID=3486 RepID=UPI002B411B28|nr:protein XRI1-like [Humulus lupulus]